MAEFLSQIKLQTLHDHIIITPAGGTRHIMPLASMLVGNDIRIAVLLDGDQPGLQKGRDLKQKLLVDGVIIDSFTGKTNSEIEDFFEESLYIDAVKNAYPQYDIKFSVDEEKIHPIIDRMESMFKRNAYDKFEKWKANNVLLTWIGNQASEKKISKETCEKFENLFKTINQILTK